MKYCTNCGEEIGDVKFCPHCGAPTSLFTQPEATLPSEPEPVVAPSDPLPQPIPPMQSSQNSSKSVPGKPGCLRKIIIGIIILAVLSAIGSASGKKSASNSKPVSSSKPTAGIAAAKSSAAPSSEPAAKPVPVVFYVDLEKGFDSCENKYVETTVPVDDIFSGGVIIVKQRLKNEIRIETGDDSLRQKEDKMAFVTVRGLVGKKSGDILLSDALILWYGNSAPDTYEAQIIQYEERVKQAKIDAREAFIESAIDVSYDDLRRYPDTYKGQALKLHLHIKEVEVDGLIFNGNIRATYHGGEIGVYDYRDMREPRIMEGDSITIYGTGAGLSTIKVYEKGTGLLGTSIGANVVDQYEIPVVNMLYTEKDNTDLFTVSDTKSEDVYDQKADELIDGINGLISDFKG